MKNKTLRIAFAIPLSIILVFMLLIREDILDKSFRRKK